MSPFLFAKRILAGESIDVFNHGDHARDFTFIDDVVEGIVRILDHIPEPNPKWDSLVPDPSSSSAPYRLFNIGNERPVELLHFIACLEKAIGKSAVTRLLPPQPGEVHRTYADIDEFADAVGFRPLTSIEIGVQKFVQWYRNYYTV